MSRLSSILGDGWGGDGLIRAVFSSFSIAACQPAGAREQFGLCRPIAPRYVSFWSCWVKTGGTRSSLKDTWAICSDVTKSTSAMREALHQTRSGVT
jgi:hypothetical protein